VQDIVSVLDLLLKAKVEYDGIGIVFHKNFSFQGQA
jgi:hypothetical protein